MKVRGEEGKEKARVVAAKARAGEAMGAWATVVEGGVGGAMEGEATVADVGGAREEGGGREGEGLGAWGAWARAVGGREMEMGEGERGTVRGAVVMALGAWGV